MPIAEAKPSERLLDGKGRLICTIARPMIDFYLDLLRTSPQAQKIIGRFNRDWSTMATPG